MAAAARKWFEGWGTAMLAGALFAVFIGRTAPDSTRWQVPVMALIGALYALGVLGLVRLFGTRSFGLPVAGLLAGPLPAAILMGSKAARDDRAGLLLVGALLGLVVGLLEWARVRT